jgi:membrane-bound metal-dependent hydrolase YbcI (DUF457 family)
MMRGRTHAAIGLVAGVALGRVSGDTSLWPPAAAVAGSLLPDLDEPNATAARLPSMACQEVGEALRPGLACTMLAPALRLAARATETVTTAVAGAVKARLGHRGPIHSLAVAVGLTCLVTAGSILVAGNCTSWRVGAAFGLGFVTHLIGDCTTARGVPLWWPISRGRVRLGTETVRSFIDQLLT